MSYRTLVHFFFLKKQFAESSYEVLFRASSLTLLISLLRLLRCVFIFFLLAQKKTKQKKKAPQTKAIFPTSRAVQPFQAAYTPASNGPRCSWTSSPPYPRPFCTTRNACFPFIEALLARCVGRRIAGPVE